MIGVVPLGTGNDMARVLGWGAQCHDEEKIPTILSEMEQSSFKLMDRWSIQYSTEADLDISSMISAITVSQGDSYCTYIHPGGALELVRFIYRMTFTLVAPTQCIVV